MSIAPNKNAPNEDRSLSADKIKNLTHVTAGTAAGSAVALGISSKALILGGGLAAGALSLATFSPLPATVASTLFAADLATGLPVTKAMFVAAAFAATHWVTKTAIAAGQAVVDAVKTTAALGGKTVEAVQNMIGGSQRPSPAMAGAGLMSQNALT